VTKLDWGYSHVPVPSNRPVPLGFGAQAPQQARRRNPAMEGYVSEWRSSATVTRPPCACRHERSYCLWVLVNEAVECGRVQVVEGCNAAIKVIIQVPQDALRSTAVDHSTSL
jgi:hypothetical protein